MGQSKHASALTNYHPFQVSPQSTSLMPSSHSISLGIPAVFLRCRGGGGGGGWGSGGGGGGGGVGGV